MSITIWRAVLVAGLIATASGAARAHPVAFDVLSYDVRLRPDFSAQQVSGTETVTLKSLVPGLDAVSFSANALSVVASIDGEALVASEVVGERRVFHLPKRLAMGQVARSLATI